MERKPSFATAASLKALPVPPPRRTTPSPIINDADDTPYAPIPRFDSKERRAKQQPRQSSADIDQQGCYLRCFFDIFMSVNHSFFFFFSFKTWLFGFQNVDENKRVGKISSW